MAAGPGAGRSGSINGLAFLRGSPRDFDRWAQAGARGWSWEEVVRYFRRLEDWRGPAGETRGRGGPLPVSEPAHLSPGAAAFVAACGALGFPRLRDVNDGPIEGAAPIQLNTRGGQRHSTAGPISGPRGAGRTCASSPAPPRNGC